MTSMSGLTDVALRVFLPVYFVLYIFTGYTLAVAHFKKTYGFDPTPVRHHDPIIRLGESYRNVIFGIVLLITLANAIHPPLLAQLGPIPILQAPFVRVVGVIVLIGSLALVRVSQRHLRSSWRIGLDLAAAPPDLITDGLYARSRNPIYVGMAATGVGLLLVLPNAVTLAIAAMILLLLQVRIRVEERYLLTVHGEAYAAYCSRTPRWLIGPLFRARSPIHEVPVEGTSTDRAAGSIHTDMA